MHERGLIPSWPDVHLSTNGWGSGYGSFSNRWRGLSRTEPSSRVPGLGQHKGGLRRLPGSRQGSATRKPGHVARPIAPHRKLAGQHRHRRIMARFVVVVQILIARRDPRADHFSPPIKKSGGTERIPSGGAGSHVLGFLAACAGSASGAGRGSSFLPGVILLPRLGGCVGGIREDTAGKGWLPGCSSAADHAAPSRSFRWAKGSHLGQRGYR